MIRIFSEPARTRATARIAASLVAWGWFGLFPARGQLSERYFAEIEAPLPQVCIAVFYPTTGTIQALAALRREGLMPRDSIIVVGVYHELETSNYQAARRYVLDRQLDWVQFHKVSGELSPATIYQSNPCSADFELIVRLSDGAILFGGPDIPPHCYGQKTRLTTVVEDRLRHYLDLSFVFHLLGGWQNESWQPFLTRAPEYPLLGICLGAQTINVATGGTLVQDIWWEVYRKTTYEDVLRLGSERWHTNPYRRLHPEAGFLGYQLHPIRLKEGGVLCQSWGFSPADKPLVVSAHHQAVGKRGKGIMVAATSADGRVVEAISHATFKNVVGVQFHPDFAILWDAGLRFKFVPGGEENSLRATLEANPPSFAFNRRVWTWFFAMAAEQHRARLGAKAALPRVPEGSTR